MQPRVHAQVEDHHLLQRGTTILGTNNALSLQLSDSRYFHTNLGLNQVLSDRFGLGGAIQFGTDFSDIANYNVSLNGSFAFMVGNQQLVTLSRLGYGQLFSDHDLYQTGISLLYPVQLKQSNIFLTPRLAYEYELDDRESQNFHTQEAGIGVELYARIPNGKWFGDQESEQQDRYQAGTQMWGSNSRLVTDLQRQENKIDDGREVISNRRHLTAFIEYSYYLIDNFAIGATAQGSSSTKNHTNNTYPKSSSWDLLFQPLIRWHPLKNSWANNVFIEGGVGIAASSSDTDDNAFDRKTRTTWVHSSTGVFVVLAPNIYLSPSVQYRRSTFENLDSDDAKITGNRLWLAIELRYALD